MWLDSYMTETTTRRKSLSYNQFAVGFLVIYIILIAVVLMVTI